MPRARVALVGGTDTGGGLGAFQNPEATAIRINRVTVHVTTVATGACALDAGTTATSAVTLSDNLIDGADVHTALADFDNVSNPGSNGKAAQSLAAGKWLTFSMADAGASAGLVGTAYIDYILED